MYWINLDETLMYFFPQGTHGFYMLRQIFFQLILGSVLELLKFWGKVL